MIGNSMGEKIEDGSTLAIDRGLTQIVDGEIYAIEHDGMLRIKYLHRTAGQRPANAQPQQRRIPG